jgi:hypothetical protein
MSESTTDGRPLAFDGRAEATDSAWRSAVTLHTARTDRPAEGRSPAGCESFLLVLSGTLDLVAGGGAWLRRGRRADPFAIDERPVGVFLPPDTPWKASGGEGDLLVVSARQPDEPTPPTPTEAAAAKPLLQIAGSGKAFDSRTQSWKPKESFLSSPEAILPRRIDQTVGEGGVVTRTVLPADYKTLGLGLLEAVLPSGASWTVDLPALPEGVAGWPAEWLAFVRSAEGEDTVLAGSFAQGRPTFRGRGASPTYVALVLAGAKLD